jgi:hypothetical protein
MKNIKLFFLFIMLSFAKIFGQGYSINIVHSYSYSECYNWDFKTTIKGDSNLIQTVNDYVYWKIIGYDPYSSPPVLIEGKIFSENKTFNIPRYNNFNISADVTPSLKNDCDPGFPLHLYGMSYNSANDLPVCDYNLNKTVSAAALIKSITDFNNCAGVTTIDLRPIVTIQNLNPLGAAIACSGEQLNLSGTPAGFPNEAYHWQYSIDNQATWIDVPYGLNGIPNSNDNPNSNFSIEDLLGINHIKYWGKKIYFRLGYENRPFTTPYEITYSPCAPIVKSITCNPPLCAGDKIQDVTITFNRDLYPNETLKNLSIIKTDGTLSGIEIPLIEAFEGTDPNNKFYAKRDFTGLENDTVYSVKYQAFQGTIARGVITTDRTFPYKEIKPLTFKTIPIDPRCNGDMGGITITAMGGTPDSNGNYFYILDNNGINVPFKSPTTIEVTPQEHKVKVIDSNSCFEKTQ